MALWVLPRGARPLKFGKGLKSLATKPLEEGLGQLVIDHRKAIQLGFPRLHFRIGNIKPPAMQRQTPLVHRPTD